MDEYEPTTHDDNSLVIVDSPSRPHRVPVSVAVDPVALVVTECITVTSAMRKHARWAHSSVAAILGGGGGSSTKLDTASALPRKFPVDKTSRLPVPKSGDDVGLASRWGLRGKKGQSMQDNPLLAAFARLRSDLKRCKDIYSVDAPAILHPFLQVIRSSSTSAPITSLALIAITRFLAYDIIGSRSLQLPLAMQLLSSAVTHCRFEASDAATDEIVLLRILKLMEKMITGAAGEVLGDESMCEMMETGISMCVQVRLSELLRRTAEVSMVTMCQTIFQRLKILEVPVEEDEPEIFIDSSAPPEEGPKMEPELDGNMLAAPQSNAEGRSSQSMDQSRESSGESSGPDAITLGGTVMNGGSELDLNKATEQVKTEETPQEINPYGLPSIRELFRVLVNLLDPHDKQHNDNLRVMALRIVDVALEVAGPSIASHPSLANLAKDTLCRHLFQLVRSENIAILNESLRVAGTLLATCRRVLKLQQELFLSYLVACLHPRVDIPQEPGIDAALYEGVPQAPKLVKQAPSQSSSGRSTPVPIKDRQRLGLEGGTRKPDAREAMIESVGALVRIPSFMAELFVNYDCEIDRSDLCLDMVGLMSRNAFPDAATWSTTNVPPLCLDALLGYIHSITDRLDDPTETEGFPPLQELRQQRAHKKVIIKGATRYNENPKAGLAFLASQGIISDLADPTAVVRFLRSTNRVDKKVVGEFLAKKGNEALLVAFLDTFDFGNLRVDEALRQLLNSFRLPGEAPLIERIVNEFSSKYFNGAQPKSIKDKDGVYVLTYAIIMLNTDQHNPNVKSQNRMSFLDFSRNLRGVNGGTDFDSDYLQEIYGSIKTREIILPEEHDNKHSFDHAWKELLLKIQSTKDLTICETNLFDADMFRSTWKPVIATLSFVFMSATDDTVFARVVTGFDQCAQIAAKYELNEALDHIIFCLASISSLANPTLPSTSLNTEMQAGDRTVMVSETAVKFGRDFKAQLATVVLFRVVVGHEATVREGWTHLVHIMLNLFVNSLITSSYATVFSNADIDPIPSQSPAQVVERTERSEAGLLSAFTSYVTSFASDEPPEPSDQEVENTLCTVDCVNACAFDSLFSNISQLPFEALCMFLRTLLQSLPEEQSPRVITVKPELPAPTPVRPNGQKLRPVSLAYDPSVVFILEFATILAARDPQTIAELGKEVAEALQSVVRDAAHMHPVTLSRCVYYLLSFLRASSHHDFIRVPVVLHIISKFDLELFKQAASYIVRGLSLCLNGPPGLRNEMVNSPDFWSVLKSLQDIEELSAEVFSIVENVAEGSTSAITADNYEFVVSLLNDYATAGSIGAAAEQRRDEATRKGKRPSKAPTPSPAVVRGSRALQIVYQMTSRVPGFIQHSQLEEEDAWNTYWFPVFRILIAHSLNPCRQIRGQSLSSLQRVLLSPSLGLDPNSGTAPLFDSPTTVRLTTVLFTEVLFRLIKSLLKPDVWQSDPAGMGETRLQAAVLCCKVFVRYVDSLLDAGMTPPESPTLDMLRSPLSSNGDMSLPPMPRPTAHSGGAIGDADEDMPDGVTLWSAILTMMERLFKSGGHGAHEGLEEAVPESLKNVMLVMASAGYLSPPPLKKSEEERTPLQVRLWEVTWDRLEKFLPGLVEGAFPGAGRAPEPEVVEVGKDVEGKDEEEKPEGKGEGEENKTKMEEHEAQDGQSEESVQVGSDDVD